MSTQNSWYYDDVYLAENLDRDRAGEFCTALRATSIFADHELEFVTAGDLWSGNGAFLRHVAA
jgi:hypothetical protein